MKRASFCALVYFLLVGAAFAESLRVATYNVRNYLEVDRWVDGRYRPQFPKPEEEKRALRRALLSVRPDILVLQEMGSGPYLGELQEDLKREGLAYPYRYLAEGADKERHVALLSRIEPSEVFTHKDLNFNYFNETIPVKRGLLEVVFQTEGIRWKVFGLHLKSKWSDVKEDPDSNDRRRSEALAVRKRILELREQDGLPFLVLGDFNDTKSTAPVRLLQNRGRMEVATAVEAFDSRGDRWTHFYEKEDAYTRIDYILRSPDFPAELLDNRGYIFDGADMMKASDHRMVWIDLEWKVRK